MIGGDFNVDKFKQDRMYEDKFELNDYKHIIKKYMKDEENLYNINRFYKFVKI